MGHELAYALKLRGIKKSIIADVITRAMRKQIFFRKGDKHKALWERYNQNSKTQKDYAILLMCFLLHFHFLWDLKEVLS